MNSTNFLREWRLDNREDTILNGGERYQWQGGEYIRVTCPFCKLDKKLGPDLGHHVHVHEAWFKCQRCGTKGGLNYLIGRNLPIPTHPKDWKSHTTSNGPRAKPKKMVDLFGGPASKSSPGRTVWLGDLSISHPAWKYLMESEKFPEREIRELLEHFPMHVCIEGRQFTKNEENLTTGRLIFTVLEQNQQIGWQARWLPKHWPPRKEDIEQSKRIDKYITSPSFKKSFTLYNIDNAMKWDTIFVVEGAKKVHKLGLFSVASFGVGNNTQAPEGLSATETNSFWINRLISASKEGREIVFLYDKDAVGKAMIHNEAILEAGGNSSVMTLPIGGPKDVDNYFRAQHIQHILKMRGKLPKRIKA